MQYRTVGIKFNDKDKVYSFDPQDLALNRGDNVIVDTNRGVEYGTVMTEIVDTDEKSLVLPLKPVLRIATDKDLAQHKLMQNKSKEATKIVSSTIEKSGLDMKLVDVEYVFDGSKVLINFVSDSRVDFRDLVKELATKLKTRVELRQIGIRDQSKLVGGIGICGRPCCCSTFLNDFEKVSIKMAKNQNLSLNPTKISGLCGRLMCCLEYENPYYAETLSKMPKVGSTVSTPDGKGTVVYQNILKQIVSVKLNTEELNNIKDYNVKDVKFDKPNQPNQPKNQKPLDKQPDPKQAKQGDKTQSSSPTAQEPIKKKKKKRHHSNKNKDNQKDSNI